MCVCNSECVYKCNSCTGPSKTGVLIVVVSSWQARGNLNSGIFLEVEHVLKELLVLGRLKVLVLFRCN